jgi:formylglycine-generating enzyme required for sulfatase activity
MAGNVAEWVSDSYGPYGKDADPTLRVVRDSGWGQFQPRFIRTTARGWDTHALHSDNVGFRCAR